MRIQSIYIDTSVLGGYFDKEFDVATQRLFDQVKKVNTMLLFLTLPRVNC